MNGNKKKVIYWIIGVIISITFSAFHLTIVDYFFIEKIQINRMHEKMKDFSPSWPPSDEKIEVEISDTEWPWYAITVYYAVLIMYWYFFGKIFRKFVPAKTWIPCLAVPIITSLLYMDFVLPLYLVSCFTGGKRGRLRVTS